MVGGRIPPPGGETAIIARHCKTKSLQKKHFDACGPTAKEGGPPCHRKKYLCVNLKNPFPWRPPKSGG